MKRVKSDVEKGHDKTRREKNRARAKLAEREWHLKTKYGLTLADYALLLEQHNGLCALCGQPPPQGRLLDIDHDHETGHVRGLLCNKCNRGLGALGDSLMVLERAVRYLKERS